MILILKAYGNPDYQQYTDIAPMEVHGNIASIEEAQHLTESYMMSPLADLGGGNWGLASGALLNDDATDVVGRFSYNMRYWSKEQLIDSGHIDPASVLKEALECLEDLGEAQTARKPEEHHINLHDKSVETRSVPAIVTLGEDGINIFPGTENIDQDHQLGSIWIEVDDGRLKIHMYPGSDDKDAGEPFHSYRIHLERFGIKL